MTYVKVFLFGFVEGFFHPIRTIREARGSYRAWDRQQRVNDFCRMVRAKREAEEERKRRQDEWIASLTWQQKQQIIDAGRGWVPNE